jgi:hypothetical protein
MGVYLRSAATVGDTNQALATPVTFTAFTPASPAVVGKPIGLGCHGVHGAPASHMKSWVTKGHAARPCSSECLPGASMTAANDLDFGGRPFGQLAVLIGTARHAGGHAATGGRPEITAVTAFVPVPR